MIEQHVPPFVVYFAGALVAAVLPARLRPVAMLAIPLLGAFNLYGLWGLEGSYFGLPLFGYRLELLRVDELSMLFGILFNLAAFLSVLFALHVKDRVQNVAGLVYAGSALGAVFAGDLITLFLFWELLALSSVFLVLARGTEAAYRSAMRYLIIQVLSGVILLSGVLMHLRETGSIEFGLIGLAPGADGTLPLGALLILIGIGIKCAFPLLHNWMTDAYPSATATGTVFLSAFTTKVAVYALARGYPGTEALIYIGAVMTMYPIFYAVIENDLRRVLSYSMMNQVGFMVCGIGIGTAMAVNGAVSHAFNDVIFKGLLFMSMGAVMLRTGTTKASDLGGLYKTMPWTTIFCIVGALSISAMPLFSGFVSKSMVMVAALEEGHAWVWLALVFASAGVVEHAGIKIPYFGFFAHDSGLRPKEAPFNMLLAMGLAAAICIFNGSYPWVLYSLLPYDVDYDPFATGHVVTQIQLLLFATLGVVTLHMTGYYPAEIPSVNIDAEWIYRKFLPKFAHIFDRYGVYTWQWFADSVVKGATKAYDALYRHHGPEGLFGRTWPTGTMAFWTTVTLGAVVILSYL